MGVNLKDIAKGEQISLSFLFNKIIAVDAFNWIYQFLTSIRQIDGTPLRDSKGRITSHLSGLFYRNINLLKQGIKLIYVFDGEKVKLKSKEIEKREERKREAEVKYLEAVSSGDIEKMALYAKQFSRLTPEIIKSSKKLLSALGIPYVDAKTEGEAQAAYLVKKGIAFATGSQDWDSLIFGSPKLIRNLNIVGKRKLPRKQVYIDIKPELVELNKVLENLNISREQLISIAILIGTDFNEGVRGIGPKKALDIVKKYKDPSRIFKLYPVENWEEVYNFFLNPEVNEIKEVEFGSVNEEEVIKILVDEHDFSLERVKNALKDLKEAKRKGKQKSLFEF